MKLGIQIPNFSYPGDQSNLGEKLDEIVKTVDSSGFYSLWVMDHYFQIQNLFGLNYDEPMLESYSALNYFAGITNNVMLGSLVTGVIYRNPAFLVKQVTTLDVLSKGRAYYGIGAGWYKEEAENYGFPFPSTSDRFEMLEEALQLSKQMFSEDNSEFKGKHYQIEKTLNSPNTYQKPHPKIMIGGMGEKKTLRLVAQYADTCNLFMGPGIEVVGKKLDVLKNHCERLGRDYSEIEKTTLGTINLMPDKQGPQDVIDILTQLSKLGIEHAIVNLPNIAEITVLDTLRDEVSPAISDL